MRVRFWGVRGSVPWATPSAIGHGCNTPCLQVTDEHTGDTLILDAGSGIVGLGASLDGPPREMKILVQAVRHESRVHLDIETDDVEAETSRLEGLGARRVAKVKTWWVMEAPTGQRFCVVRPQRADFEENANVWQT